MVSEKEKFEKHADEHIYLYDKKIKMKLSEDIKNILNRFKNKKVKMVDIGSGDGNLAMILANKKNVQLDVTDISQKRLDRIKEVTKNKLNKYIQDDITKSKLKSNHYDFVNSEMVMEHVPSDKKMVKEVFRILKKDGYFRITTVFKDKFSFWFYRNNDNWVIDPTHVREYTSEKEMKRMFEKEGLKVESIKKSRLTFNPFIFIQKKLKLKLSFLEKLKIQKPGYYSITIIGKK